MKRHFPALVTTGLVALLTTLAVAQTGSRYQELLAAPGTSMTVRSLGLAMLALPLERQHMEQQLMAVWWANNPQLDLGETPRELEIAKLRRQLDRVESVVRQYKLSELSLCGFTQIGTVKNIDLYYAANSNAGPILFRASVAFHDGAAGARLHEIRIYEGFEEARQAVAQISEFAAKEVATITYRPAAAPANGR